MFLSFPFFYPISSIYAIFHIKKSATKKLVSGPSNTDTSVDPHVNVGRSTVQEFEETITSMLLKTTKRNPKGSHSRFPAYRWSIPLTALIQYWEMGYSSFPGKELRPENTIVTSWRIPQEIE
jgi:hypothetical protein